MTKSKEKKHFLNRNKQETIISPHKKKIPAPTVRFGRQEPESLFIKEGGDLLSRIALQYHRRGRA